MDLANTAIYLRLLYSQSLSLPVFARLLSEYGSVENLQAQSTKKLGKIGLRPEQIDDIVGSHKACAEEAQVDAAIHWSEARDCHLLCYESVDYPPLLREIDCAPPLLFVRGSPAAMREPVISMVGSRKASTYGRHHARMLAAELAELGLHICSGLAIGIDTLAHEGALQGNGKTIAVIGSGIDRVYPARNRALAERIIDSGALVSEFPLGTRPFPSNFPRRNRIISGLAMGTVVVEGNIKSGSLITARLAMEQNREVFAVPGSIGSEGSRGCHQLIKQGARLVEGAQDVAEELGLDATALQGSAADESKADAGQAMETNHTHGILQAIAQHGGVYEAILKKSRLGQQELNIALIELEAAGAIYQEGGRYFRFS